MPCAPPRQRKAPRLLALLLASLGAVPCFGVRRPSFPKLKQDAHGLRCVPFFRHTVDASVTAVVSVAARPQDGSGRGLEALKHTVLSIRNVLGLKSAHVVVAFDALPLATDESKGATTWNKYAAECYTKKIRDFEEWSAQFGRQVSVFKNLEWTHQTEMLRRVFEDLENKGRLTPIVFIAQDDSPVSGSIDVPFIMQKLACDERVDYVKFLWAPDCFDNEQAPYNQPCIQHPDTPLLQNITQFSDRPHFATVAFYGREVFDKCPRRIKRTPEQCLSGVTPKMWVYGARHNMLHDTNEFWLSYNKKTYDGNDPWQQ